MRATAGIILDGDLRAFRSGCGGRENDADAAARFWRELTRIVGAAVDDSPQVKFGCGGTTDLDWRADV